MGEAARQDYVLSNVLAIGLRAWAADNIKALWSLDPKLSKPCLRTVATGKEPVEASSAGTQGRTRRVESLESGEASAKCE